MALALLLCSCSEPASPSHRGEGDGSLLFLVDGGEPRVRQDDGARADRPPPAASPDASSPAGGASAACECLIAKRVFEIYNADRVAHSVARLNWDEGTARLTTEAARVMAFETGFQHSSKQIKGYCRKVSGSSSKGTYCYVNEERITRYRCKSPPCTVEQVASGLYGSLKQYSSRYKAEYTYYSVGVFFEGDTFWLTEWMNTAPSLPGGGKCFRCHCPGKEADRVPVTYDPADTPSFCPHWINPIWDANVTEFPVCTIPHFNTTLAGQGCGASPALK
jgi:hypothetical protein